MTGADWPEEFEKLLRPHLSLLADGTQLTGQLSLPELGLDSMSTVGLLIELEDFFDIQLPDSALTPETFATPAALWSVILGLREEVAVE